MQEMQEEQQQLEPLTMSVDDGALLAGVDRKTLYQAIERKEVPGVVRIGRRILLNRRAFVQWLQGGPTSTGSST